MDKQIFNSLTLPERILIIRLKARFIAQWQSADHQFGLYHWAGHFIEIQYHWQAQRGLAAQWEPRLLSVFVDGPGCMERLLPYAESIQLPDWSV